MVQRVEIEKDVREFCQKAHKIAYELATKHRDTDQGKVDFIRDLAVNFLGNMVFVHIKTTAPKEAYYDDMAEVYEAICKWFNARIIDLKINERGSVQ